MKGNIQQYPCMEVLCCSYVPSGGGVPVVSWEAKAAPSSLAASTFGWSSAKELSVTCSQK